MMTGPKATVLLASAADREQVAALIDDSFATMESTLTHAESHADAVFDGTIEKHRFLVQCGLEYEERLEDLDIAGLSGAFGWAPVDEVRIAAMHGTPEDHVLLARVCIEIAEKFGGVVEFGGKPWTAPDEIVGKIGGRLVTLPAFDAGEAISEEATCAYGDAAFLKKWMKDSAFRMVEKK